MIFSSIGGTLPPEQPLHQVKNLIVVDTKAATDPKNWIRDPAGSDPDPDPLTNGTFFY